MESLLSVLRSTRWGSMLAAEHLERVAAESREMTLGAGATLCRRGEPVDAWFGVIEGMVKIMSTGPDGRSSTFTGVATGGWFGEGSLLKSEPRRYEVVALRHSRIAVVPRGSFEWLLNTSLPFNRFLLVQLNERLGQFIGMLETQRLDDPDARVARCIAALFNPILYPGIERKLEVSQEEIGFLVGISRQRVNQALRNLQQAGLLRIDYGSVLIDDLEGLRQYAP